MVLGASGFIGPAVVRRLRALGHDPLAVSRSGPLAADRDDPDAVVRLAARQGADAVVDLLALTLGSTRPLLEALSGRVGRYVLVSSGDVYRQYGALQRKEEGGAPVQLLDEDAPLRTRLHPYRRDPPRPASDPQAWMDDYDKIPIERAVLGHISLEGAVVRLPMVFGPGDRQRRFAWAIRPMHAGAAAMELDRQWASWRTTYGFVDDVAEGVALAAVLPAAAGRTYNVGMSEAPDHAAWARRVASALGWTGELRTVEREAVDSGLRRRLDGMDLSYPLVTDTRRIRAELGYVEVTDPEEALRRTIEDEIGRV